MTAAASCFSHAHPGFSLAGSRIVRALGFILNMRSVEYSKKTLWFKDWEIIPLNLLKMIKRKKIAGEIKSIHSLVKVGIVTTPNHKL